MRKQLLTTFAIQMHTGLDVVTTNKEIALSVGVRTNNQASSTFIVLPPYRPALLLIGGLV
jgi:hypothetical protein